MHRDQHNLDESSMTRESQEQKPEAELACAEGPVTPVSKRGRKKDMTPEKASELQARQRAIGGELRRIFDDVAKEAVPKDLMDLLQQIDRKRED
jgi:hypothetical protein